MAQEFDFTEDYAGAVLDELAQSKASQNDGIYRFDPTKSPEQTHKATLRFLPYIKTDGTKGNAILEKHLHYVKDVDEALNGYYDCQKDVNSKCELCTLYWKYHNSIDVTEKDKCNLIKRTNKYYAYVYVIEDNTYPENVGKVMLLPFGIKIFEKIQNQEKGELGPKCKVFDLVNGKEFKLVVKKVGGHNNYDSSAFMDQTSPLRIFNPETGKFKALPFYEDEATGNKYPGVAGDKEKTAEVHAKLKTILMTRSTDMESFVPKEWDDTQRDNIYKVINILNHADDVTTPNKHTKASFETDSDPFDEPKTSKKTSTIDDDDFDSDF